MKYLCLLALIPFGIRAQYNDRHYNSLFNTEYSIRYKWYDMNPNSLYGGKDVSLTGVVTVKRYRAGRSGKQQLINTQTYNANGLLTGDTQKKVAHRYRYQDTLLAEVTSVFPNGKTYGSTYAYDGESRLTDMQHYSKGKLDETYRYVYSGKVCTVREYTDLSRRKKHVYLLTNELNEDGKIAKATYTVDGKVKKVWDYSCNEKGTIAEDKTLAQSSSCTFEQHNNDGSYAIFTRSIKGGKTYLTEDRYSADSVLTGWKEFLNDSILVRQRTLTKDYSRFDAYTEKGKYDHGYESRFNAGGRKTETRVFNKHGHECLTTFIIYNEGGLISNIHMHNGRGKKYSEELFEYSSDAF